MIEHIECPQCLGGVEAESCEECGGIGSIPRCPHCEATAKALAQIVEEMRATVRELCGPESNELVRTHQVRVVVGEWADRLGEIPR